MTLLAGVFSRYKEGRLEDSICEDVRRALTREPDDEIVTFRDARCFLAKVDIGAFGAPAFRAIPGGSVAMLAGEPLLCLGTPAETRTRTQDLEALQEALDQGDLGVLAGARGVFAAVHYDPEAGRLSLIADKLGIRPLYYSVGKKYVVFASALRSLESLSEFSQRMDLRAVTEAASLGFPLGTRTPYSTVAMMRAGEIVQVSARDATRSQYWRWDELTPSALDEPALLTQAHERFTDAVMLRLRGDAATVAFLSGGMDSRCVVAALRAAGAQVHTFNFFAGPRTQDQVFGAAFSQAAGTIHQEVPMEAGAPQWSMMMATAWGASAQRAELPPEHPHLVWSGDGGSVGLGHVYMSDAVVKLLRAGQSDAAIHAFLEEQHAKVVRSLLKPSVAALLTDVLHEGMRQELDDLHGEDPARRFHLVLMLNDQRRHLAEHFENIDVHRLEFQLPFFDSAFLETILAAPIDLMLGHRFYTKWFGLFPPMVTSVPWQTYPGHVPCPLPAGENLGYQWNRQQLASWQKTEKQALLREASMVLEARDFPFPIINRGYLRLATWVYGSGLRDYSYVIKAARTYHRYWRRSGGNYLLPPH